MAVYLLHFSAPFGHSRHYTGYAKDERLDERVAEHMRGTGAKLTSLARQAGITFTLARVWQGGREVEQRMKYRDGIKTGVRRGMAKYCPRCREG